MSCTLVSPILLTACVSLRDACSLMRYMSLKIALLYLVTTSTEKKYYCYSHPFLKILHKYAFSIIKMQSTQFAILSLEMCWLIYSCRYKLILLGKISINIFKDICLWVKISWYMFLNILYYSDSVTISWDMFLNIFYYSESVSLTS